MTQAQITSIVSNQHAFFASHQTKSIAWRKVQLQKLYCAIEEYENALKEAFWIDLHKSSEEAFLTEISLVLQEIKHHANHLRKWSKPRKVSTALSVVPSKSYILHEPLGVALIIAPWNYPFQLLFNPLVGAISAGCCAILKPSPYTPNVAQVMQKIIESCFEPNYITLIQGDREINTLLLKERYDFLFFTGSPAFGKSIMEAAAKHLTPVVLELGGKSPCIVDESADLKIAAKRIVWGKCINAGQTCIAPDYLMVHTSVKESLIDEIRKVIIAFFGENPQESMFYPRIVNVAAMERLQTLMLDGDIIYGGTVDLSDHYISPTLIDNIKPEHAIMQQEIFGPLLPIMTFNTINEVVQYVNAHEKPLALYYFGKRKTAKYLLEQTSSGGVCINDTLLHITNPHLPFGGVGQSGMGRYHHHASFLAFSNTRSVLDSVTWFDLIIKYPPFKGLKWLQNFLR